MWRSLPIVVAVLCWWGDRERHQGSCGRIVATDAGLCVTLRMTAAVRIVSVMIVVTVVYLRCASSIGLVFSSQSCFPHRGFDVAGINIDLFPLDVFIVIIKHPIIFTETTLDCNGDTWHLVQLLMQNLVAHDDLLVTIVLARCCLTDDDFGVWVFLFDTMHYLDEFVGYFLTHLFVSIISPTTDHNHINLHSGERVESFIYLV